MESSTTLDLVADVLILNDNATFRWVTRASTAVDQKAGASTHVVGGGWVQVVAVWHALEGVHVSEGVGSWWQWTDTLLASARWIISAGTRLAGAGTSCVNIGSVVTGTPEVVRGNIIGVWTTSCDVQVN